MRNKIKHFFLFLICFSGQNLFSQDESEILKLIEKTNNYYSKSNQPLDINYKLFSTHSSKLITEEYDGFSIKKENSYYIRIHNTEFLQKNSLSIKINHDQKIVLVTESNMKPNSPIDLSNYLKHFKNKILKNDGANYRIILETNVLTQLPYGKVEILINKSNFKIEKQILYLLDNVPFIEKGAKKNGIPRLEILFKEKKISPDVIEELFNTQNYIIKNKSEYILPKKYSNYKLLNK